MANFKVDENLPTEAAELLASAGHDAATVGDQRMVGQPDTNVATVCQRGGNNRGQESLIATQCAFWLWPTHERQSPS